MRSKMGGQSNGTWTPTKRRGPIAAEFSSPGPAAIALKSSIGKSGTGTSNANVGSRAPAFTMASRHEMKLDKAGPGPGQYNVTGLSNKGKDEPVAASMHIRPKDPKAYVTPAPCDYSPDKAESKVVETSPSFSFGIKVENGRASDAPAPNSYNIPSLLGSTKEGSKHSAPSFTMSARAREEEDKMKVPGPGSYNDATVDKYKTIKSPSFSMGQRTTIPSDHTMKPGPGAHCPEKYQDSGPAFTMAPRIDDAGDKMKVPGPGTYESGDLDKCREKLPAFTMSPKTVLPTDNTPKPAPNAYAPEKYTPSGPKFTMSARLPDEEDKMKVPGPGAYEAGNLDKSRESQPAFTMAPKTTLPGDRTQKPAPNAYSPDRSESSEIPSTPHFSFGIKHSVYLGKLRDQ
ncbi:outer dense fiber protein 3-like isoform X2 [Portunus trituberculatus]|uniref:outer dense fiber protein 3-like isoform X2 n=1 Tax=Portunus trituberculatus TaxID=210409 RepID=UPI001E1D1286|nr:outer dense fiber protein 3-like isoform X2 [Portunus trituberculatus]